IVLDEIKNDGLTSEGIDFGKKIPQHLNFLISAVAKYHDCEGKFTSNRTISLFGYKDDVKMAIISFNFLKVTIDNLANRDFKLYKNSGGTAHGISWKSSYRKGATKAVIATLRSEKEKEKQDQHSAGTSLMVVKQQAISKKFGNFRYKSSSYSYSDKNSYNKGYKEGSKIRLSKGIESNSRNLLR
ncbi:MAG: hypothetical protein HKO92_11395, partial [Flavobacteriaceae bacterium]|nr:hypothetical protein [Flavobacteriaceae bacterium]